MTLTQRKPLEVELPVCPVCSHVGKHPGQQRMQFMCSGPKGEIHKRVKMVRYIFHQGKLVKT